MPRTQGLCANCQLAPGGCSSCNGSSARQPEDLDYLGGDHDDRRPVDRMFAGNRGSYKIFDLSFFPPEVLRE